MRHHPLTFFLLGGLSLLLMACVPQKSELRSDAVLPVDEMEPVRVEAKKLIQGMLDEDLLPGVSVALVDRDGPLWLEGFGKADLQKGTPAGAGTIYRVGSLSKPLTALAVMQLSGQQRLALDDSISRQLDGFSIRSHNADEVVITPRQLLSHRSGLPSDLRKGMYTATPFTRVTTLLQDEYIAYAADSVYSYSNLGYDLLGHLVEQKARMTFAGYMKQNIFLPLEMQSSGYEVTDAMRERLAAGHLDGLVRPQPPLRDTPALGLYSSAKDLGRLMQSLLLGRIPNIDTEMILDMWTAQTVKGQIALGYSPGLGWFIEDDQLLGRVVRHGGSTMLFGAEMALLPDHELGVVVLANGAGSNKAARKLAATILALAVKVRGTAGKPVLIRSPKMIAALPETPSGGYATDLGLLMVDPEHPRLCACIIERVLDMVRFDDGSLGLTPESAASLPPSYRVLGEMRFRSRTTNDLEVLVAERDGQEYVLGSRIESQPWDEVWKKRTGSYRTINPDGAFSIEDLRLSTESGVLCLHYKAPHLSDSSIRVPLKPVSSTEAVIEGLGRGRGETVRIVEVNGKQCIRFSGYLGEPIEDK